MDRNFDYAHPGCEIVSSLSARRAWIEIETPQNKLANMRKSLSARRAWIEIYDVWADTKYNLSSLSARRAWIEMRVPSSTVIVILVALRKESVDRNCKINTRGCKKMVALRKESVDRNTLKGV